MITVIALAFSSTIVAIQQASSKFSPRVIRNFMRDKGNQITFGSYVATFVYALLILRQVRDEQNGSGGFVPALSVTVALVLALTCVGLLIYFREHFLTHRFPSQRWASTRLGERSRSGRPACWAARATTMVAV